MSTRIATFSALLTALLAGCGAGESTPEGPAPEVDATPILERASSDRYECDVRRPRTDYAPLNWGWAGLGLVKTDAGKTFLARLEFEGDAWSPTTTQRLVLSTVENDGALGPRTALVPSAQEVSAVSAASSGDRFAVLWQEGAGLKFAAFDANGTEIVAPKAVPAPSLEAGFALPRIVSRGNDFAVLYASGASSDESLQVSFVVLDESGTPKGDVRALHQVRNGEDYFNDQLVVTTRGYAIAWSANEGTSWSVYLRELDASGEDLVPATRLVQVERKQGQVGFVSSTVRVVEVADGYLAAWTESHPGDYMGGIYSGVGHDGWAVVHVARLDARGRIVGEPALLRAVEEHIDEVEPSLTRYGDAVALSWARGAHIYVCGGCMPNHHIETVLIDPDTLDPVSNVVRIERHEAAGGGLLGREVVLVDDTMNLAFSQQYHTTSDPGTAAISCVKHQ